MDTIFIRRLSISAILFFALLVAGHIAVAATILWWDTGYLLRFNVAVTSGANVPDKGYVDYTARIATLDTQALIAAGDMQADCSDLRMTYYNGLSWQELPRHVIGCNTTTTDIRFALVANIPASATDDNYYLYHSNGAPAALPPMTETNVYLWYDDASIDRSASHGVVEQMAEEFQEREHLILGVTPEGTRSKVEEWKTGFHRIAVAADLPILLVYFDYPSKQIGFGPLMEPSDSLDDDMETIREFYRRFKGRNPENM